jgi:hypothetical protein
MCIILRTSTLALAFLAGVAFLSPSFAVEADVGPAWPELLALPADAADISPEGKPVIVAPDVVSEFPSVALPERNLPNPEMDDLSPTR